MLATHCLREHTKHEITHCRSAGQSADTRRVCRRRHGALLHGREVMRSLFRHFSVLIGGLEAAACKWTCRHGVVSLSLSLSLSLSVRACVCVCLLIDAARNLKAIDRAEAVSACNVCTKTLESPKRVYSRSSVGGSAHVRMRVCAFFDSRMSCMHACMYVCVRLCVPYMLVFQRT